MNFLAKTKKQELQEDITAISCLMDNENNKRINFASVEKNKERKKRILDILNKALNELD